MFKKLARTIAGVGRDIRNALAPEAPEEYAYCTFGCQRTGCSDAEWENCPSRLSAIRCDGRPPPDAGEAGNDRMVSGG